MDCKDSFGSEEEWKFCSAYFQRSENSHEGSHATLPVIFFDRYLNQSNMCMSRSVRRRLNRNSSLSVLANASTPIPA